jgi:hypothetical protein
VELLIVRAEISCHVSNHKSPEIIFKYCMKRNFPRVNWQHTENHSLNRDVDFHLPII